MQKFTVEKIANAYYYFIENILLIFCPSHYNIIMIKLYIATVQFRNTDLNFSYSLLEIDYPTF